MRLLILKDTKIAAKQLSNVLEDFSSFVKQNTDITPEFYIEDEDYSKVPTTPDADGDLKPSHEYLTALTTKAHSKYGNYGVDSVVILVHRDNWVFKGIWGTNWSNVYRKYHVHLVRYDDRNLANSFGTLYHEWMHSLDALIKVHTGFEIDTLFADTSCWVNWDSTVVHANRFRGCSDMPYTYIRYKENTDALRLIAPYLRDAYKVRKEHYLAPYRTVQLKVIEFLRILINRKRGVPRGT